MIIILEKYLRKVVNILKKYNYKLENLDCPNCAMKIENALKKEETLNNVSINFSKLKLSFETDSLDLDKVKSIITGLEPNVQLKKGDIWKKK